jgi:GT2 family glycosyltransferase/glycosyltransferase involved in cell wall biosynthesis
MKIAMAVHHFPPRYTGGAEWRAYRTAAALQARGHEVCVVCIERVDTGPDGSVAWEDDTYDGIAVRRLSFNLAATPDPFRWEYDNPWIAHHLREFLSKHGPDVFHLIGGYLMSGRALRVAHRLGIPTVVTLTDFWFLCPRISMLRSDGQVSNLPIKAATCARCLGEEKRRYRLPGRIAPGLMDAFWHSRKTQIRKVEARMAFLRQTLNQVDAIISPSQFLCSIFTEAGVEPGRIIFSRQGRDFPDLTPEILEKTPSSSLRVGYIGQIAWHKGVHVLFEAVRRMPHASLTVQAYGDTTPFPQYTARLRRLTAKDGRLKLTGLYRRQEVSQVLRELDVIVVPSLWYENSPNAILEAFAHRTPVVASNLGGMAELVHDEENGLLFAPGDADDLARQLRRLLDDRRLLPTLRTGIGPVKSVTQEMDELEEIYRVASGKERLQPTESVRGKKSEIKDSTMVQLPQVAIIVLNWNGLNDTLGCLESLDQLNYQGYEVVVVDNGSTDGSVPVIRERFPGVTIIENGENLGYSGGNNVGLRYAIAQGADYALLLNNDTIVDPTFLRILVDAAETDPLIGMAGPTIYYHEHPDVIWSAGGAIDWQRGSTWMVGLDERDEGQFGAEPRAVDFVTGCAMLVRRTVMEQVGLLDERFFAYYEETEWCVRAARAGYKILHVPPAWMWHKISPSTRADSPLVHYYMTRNRLLFLKTTRAGLRAWWHTLIAEYLRTLVSWSVRPKWRCKQAQRKAMLQAISDAWRRRWGKQPLMLN